MRMLFLVAFGTLGVVAACSASRSSTGTGTSANGNALSPDNSEIWGDAGDVDSGEGPCKDVFGDPSCDKAAYATQCAALGRPLAWVSQSSDGTCSYGCCSPGWAGPPAPCTPWFAVGDGTTCTSLGDLKDQATKACSDDGNRPLQELVPANDCDGGATTAQIMCCSSPPNPPAPPEMPDGAF